MIDVEIGGGRNERRIEGIDPYPVQHLAIRFIRQGLPNVEQGGAVQKLDGAIAAAACAHQQLGGNCPVGSMEQEGLIGREAPIIAEAFGQIFGAETPEGRIPSCAFAGPFLGVRDNIPAFHHFLEEDVEDKALAIRAAEIARAQAGAALALELLLRFEGSCELLCGRCDRFYLAL